MSYKCANQNRLNILDMVQLSEDNTPGRTSPESENQGSNIDKQALKAAGFSDAPLELIKGGED